jgi:chemotaxis family two-component system response regulator Rcp1
MTNRNTRPIEILLVEDNPGDVRLTREALRDAKVRNNMMVASDGVEALAYLRQEGQYAGTTRPDMILLDLNLPRINGFEVLDAIKEDAELKRIPVIILTTSQEEQDIIRSYNLYANAYVTKPVDLEQFIDVIKAIEGFWLEIVKLPDGTDFGPS